MGQYAVAGEFRCGNLIKNPHFDDISNAPCQPVGFGTDIGFVCTPPFALSGQCAVNDNPNGFNANFSYASEKWNGKYLFGDSKSGTWRVWYQQVFLIAGLRYEFGFYARNIDRITGHSGPTLDGRLGGRNGTVINSFFDIPYEVGWVTTSGRFTAQNTALTEMAIVVVGASLIGFDYGIDDISLTMVDAVTTKISRDTTICTGEKAVISVGTSHPISGMTVQWSPAGAVSNPTSPVTEYSGDSSITLIATTTLPGMMCSTNDTVHITVRQEQGSISATSSTLCSSAPVLLSVNGTEVQWSSGETTPTIEVKSPGKYTARYRLPSGCIASVSQVIDTKPVIGVKPEKQFRAIAGETFCDTITIVNYAPDAQILSQQVCHLGRNIMFSLPQHQLPLVIPPFDSVAAIVCFHPMQPGMYADTLSVKFSDYCPLDCILQGQAEEYEYDGSERCRVAVQARPFWDNVVVYPMPATEEVTVNVIGEPQIYDCRILSPQGVEFTKRRITGGKQTVFDVSQIPAGIAYLEIRGSDGTFRKQIVIIR